jgi:arabinofuranosyltransferase
MSVQGVGDVQSRKSLIRGDALLILLSIALFLAFASLFWNFTIDDSYITFRYADNLARGLGPVFNPGERVEGYTSFSWMLLMAAVVALKMDPVLISKGIGLLCSLLTFWATYRIAQFLTPNWRSVGWLAVLGLATSSMLALNAVMGLETLLYTLLLALAVLSLLREAETGSWWRSTTLFALAALTRPEGLAVFGLTWLYQAIWVRERRPMLLARLILFGAIVGGHILWRWSYYGDLLPATYYAKTGSLLPRLRAGLLYVVEFLIGPGLFLFAAYLLGLRQPDRRLRYLFWLCGGYILVIIWEGGDWMPGLRFWVAILPFLFLILAQAIITAYHRFRVHPGTKLLKTITWGGLGLLGAIYLALFVSQTLITYTYVRWRTAGYDGVHRPLATWLAEHTPPGDSVALMDIGIIGYYSHLRIIDLTGLTEAHIAHTPGAFQDKTYDPAYVLDQHPAYIVLVSTDADRVPDFPIDRGISESAAFRAGYDFLFSLKAYGTANGSGYYLLVFQRRPDR